jgi:hypothetical protein
VGLTHTRRRVCVAAFEAMLLCGGRSDPRLAGDDPPHQRLLLTELFAYPLTPLRLNNGDWCEATCLQKP